MSSKSYNVVTKIFAVITLTAFCATQTIWASPLPTRHKAQNLREVSWAEQRQDAPPQTPPQTDKSESSGGMRGKQLVAELTKVGDRTDVSQADSLEALVARLQKDPKWQKVQKSGEHTLRDVIILCFTHWDKISQYQNRLPEIMVRLMAPYQDNFDFSLLPTGWYRNGCLSYAAASAAQQFLGKTSTSNISRISMGFSDLQNIAASYLLAHQFAATGGQVHLSRNGELIYSLADLKTVTENLADQHPLTFAGKNKAGQLLTTLNKMEEGGAVFLVERPALLPDKGKGEPHAVYAYYDPDAEPTTTWTNKGAQTTVRVTVVDNGRRLSAKETEEFFNANTFNGDTVFITGTGTTSANVIDIAKTTGSVNLMPAERENKLEGCCGLIGIYGTGNILEQIYVGGHLLSYRGPEGIGVGFMLNGVFYVVRVPGQTTELIEAMTPDPAYPDKYPADGDQRREALAHRQGFQKRDYSEVKIDRIRGYDQNGTPLPDDEIMAIVPGAQGAKRHATSYQMTMEEMLGAEEEGYPRPSSLIQRIRKKHGLSILTIRDIFLKWFQVFLKKVLPGGDDDLDLFNAMREEELDKLTAGRSWAAEQPEVKKGPISPAPAQSLTAPILEEKKDTGEAEAPVVTLEQLKARYPDVKFEDVDPRKISLDNVNFGAAVTIEGRQTQIAAGAKIGDNAAIENSQLDENVVVGKDVSIEDTHLEKNVVVHGTEDKHFKKGRYTKLVSCKVNEGTHIGASCDLNSCHIAGNHNVFAGSTAHRQLVMDTDVEAGEGDLISIELNTKDDNSVLMVERDEPVIFKFVNVKDAKLDLRNIATSTKFMHNDVEVTIKGQKTFIGDGVRIARGVTLSSAHIGNNGYIGDYSTIELSEIGANSHIDIGRPATGRKGQESHIVHNVKTGTRVSIIDSTVINYYLEDGVAIKNNSEFICNESPSFGMRDENNDAITISVGPEVEGKTRTVSPFMPVWFAPYLHDEYPYDREVDFSLDTLLRLVFYTQDTGSYQNPYNDHAEMYYNELLEAIKVKTAVHNDPIPMGRVGAGTQAQNATVEDAIIGRSAVLDGSDGKVFIRRCTVDSDAVKPTSISSGANVSESFISPGVTVSHGALVNKCYIYEFTKLGARLQATESIIGPVNDLEWQQINHSLLGPFCVGHHPGGTILGVLAPRGKVNFSHIASQSNHDGLKARWETWLNEGVFLGLVTSYKWPISWHRAPFGMIGKDTKVDEQTMSHPFWIMTGTAKDSKLSKETRGKNELRPGAMLWRAFEAMTLRNWVKYVQRGRRLPKTDNLRDSVFETFRPEVMQAVIESREELSQAPRDIRESLNTIIKAFEARDAKAVFKIVLPILAKREGVDNVAAEEVISRTGEMTQNTLKLLNEQIKNGDVEAALRAVNGILKYPGINQVISGDGQEILRKFRKKAYEIGELYLKAEKEDNLQPFLEAVTWKDWYFGTPTSLPEKGYFDYEGLGDNAMSDASRRSGIGNYTRYLQWYYLNVLLKRVHALQQSGEVNGWEQIREELAKPFFEGNQNTVEAYVKALQDFKFKDADELREKLRLEWRKMDSAQQHGIPEGISEDAALDLAIEWDWVCVRFADELRSHPIGTELKHPKTKGSWDSAIISATGKTPEEFARGVEHDILKWTIEDFQAHMDLLSALIELMKDGMRYGTTERGMEEAEAIIKDLRAVHIRAGKTDVMKDLLADAKFFFMDRNNLTPEYSVRNMSRKKREQRRNEIWQEVAKVKDSDGNTGHLEIPADHGFDAVRYAFQVLDENVVSVVTGAEVYATLPEHDFSAQIQAIYERRCSQVEDKEAQPVGQWREAWNEEMVLNQAGIAFASVVEFLYYQSYSLGLIPYDIYQRFVKNDYDWAYKQGWLPLHLYNDYKDKTLQPDLLGIFTPMTVQLARRFYLAHARWAVYGMPSKINTHPFPSWNGVWLGAQNGVLDGSLFAAKRQEQQSLNIRHRLPDKRRMRSEAPGIMYRSQNDAETMVNEVQAAFERRRAGIVSAVSKNEGVYRETIAEFLLKKKRQVILKQRQEAQEAGERTMTDEQIEQFMQNYKKSLAFEDEVAVWTAMTNLATGASEFAMSIRSRLNPLAAYFVSFNRSLVIVYRPETGDVVGASDPNAAAGIWPAEVSDKAADELRILQEATQLVRQNKWDDAARTRIRQLEKAESNTKDDFINAVDAFESAWRNMQRLVPDYRPALLRELQEQVETMADTEEKRQFQRQIEAIQEYEKSEQDIISDDADNPGIRQQAFNQILSEFGYEAIELQSLPDEEGGEVGGGTANFVKVEPVYDRGKKTFKLAITTYQASIKSDGNQTALNWFKEVNPVPEEEATLDTTEPILRKGFLNPMMAAKGKYNTYVEKYIHQIPGLLRAKLAEWDRKGISPGWNVEQVKERFGGEGIPGLKRIFLFGEGSSYYVALSVKAYMEKRLKGIEIIAKRPPDALYLMGENETGENLLRLDPDADLAFIFSWSGETASMVKLTDQLRKQLRKDGTRSAALMRWLGGRILSVLARICKRSAGSKQTDRNEDEPERTIFTTRGKAGMDVGGVLDTQDVINLRNPNRSREDKKAGRKEIQDLVNTVTLLVDEEVSPDTARTREAELRAIAQQDADINQMAMAAVSLNRQEYDLKMEEGINIFGTHFAIGDEALFTALLPETIRDENGKLLTPIHNRTRPVFTITAGTADDMLIAAYEWEYIERLSRLGITFTCVVRHDHPFKNKILALREGVPAKVREGYKDIDEVELPVARIIEVPGIEPTLQPMVDQVPIFQLTPYQASEHGLSPDEIDFCRWLAKSVTIAGVAALKAISKALRGQITSVGEFIATIREEYRTMFSAWQKDARQRAREQATAEPVESSNAADMAEIVNLPDICYEVVQALLPEIAAGRKIDGFEGIESENLIKRFGEKMEGLQQICLIADAPNMPAVCNAEIPAGLLEIETSIYEITEGLPQFENRGNSTLAIIFAEHMHSGIVKQKIEGLKKQGVAVISITGDSAVSSLTAKQVTAQGQPEDTLGLGSFKASQQKLADLRNRPTVSAVADITMKSFLYYLGQKKGGYIAERSAEWASGLRRIPAAIAETLSDVSRLGLIDRMSKEFANVTAYDRRTNTETYIVYGKGFTVGSRQAYAGALALRRSFLARGTMMDTHTGDSAKHGPLAAAPDVLVFIWATDTRTMTTALSDAQTYSSRGADVILIVQDGQQNEPGIKRCGAKYVITIPQIYDIISLPVEMALAELIANSYSTALGRDRSWIDGQMDDLGLRETGPAKPPVEPENYADARRDVENALTGVYRPFVGEVTDTILEFQREGTAKWTIVQNPKNSNSSFLFIAAKDYIGLLHDATGMLTANGINIENSYSPGPDIPSCPGLILFLLNQSAAKVENVVPKILDVIKIPEAITFPGVPAPTTTQLKDPLAAQANKALASIAVKVEQSGVLGFALEEGIEGPYQDLSEEQRKRLEELAGHTDRALAPGLYKQVAKEFPGLVLQQVQERTGHFLVPTGPEGMVKVPVMVKIAENLKACLAKISGAISFIVMGPGLEDIGDPENIPPGLYAAITMIHVPPDKLEQYKDLNPLMPVDKVEGFLRQLAQIRGLSTDKLNMVHLNDRLREERYAAEFKRLATQWKCKNTTPQDGTFEWGIPAGLPSDDEVVVEMTTARLEQALASIYLSAAMPPGAFVAIRLLPGGVNNPEYIQQATNEVPIGGANDFTEDERTAVENWVGKKKAQLLLNGQTLTTLDVKRPTYGMVVPLTPPDSMPIPIEGVQVDPETSKATVQLIRIQGGRIWVQPMSLSATPLPAELKFQPPRIGTGLAEQHTLVTTTLGLQDPNEITFPADSPIAAFCDEPGRRLVEAAAILRSQYPQLPVDTPIEISLSEGFLARPGAEDGKLQINVNAFRHPLLLFMQMEYAALHILLKEQIATFPIPDVLLTDAYEQQKQKTRSVLGEIAILGVLAGRFMAISSDDQQEKLLDALKNNVNAAELAKLLSDLRDLPQGISWVTHIATYVKDNYTDLRSTAGNLKRFSRTREHIAILADPVAELRSHIDSMRNYACVDVEPATNALNVLPVVPTVDGETAVFELFGYLVPDESELYTETQNALKVFTEDNSEPYFRYFQDPHNRENTIIVVSQYHALGISSAVTNPIFNKSIAITLRSSKTVKTELGRPVRVAIYRVKAAVKTLEEMGVIGEIKNNLKRIDEREKEGYQEGVAAAAIGQVIAHASQTIRTTSPELMQIYRVLSRNLKTEDGRIPIEILSAVNKAYLENMQNKRPLAQDLDKMVVPLRELDQIVPPDNERPKRVIKTMIASLIYKADAETLRDSVKPGINEEDMDKYRVLAPVVSNHCAILASLYNPDKTVLMVENSLQQEFAGKMGFKAIVFDPEKETIEEAFDRACEEFGETLGRTNIDYLYADKSEELEPATVLSGHGVRNPRWINLNNIQKMAEGLDIKVVGEHQENTLKEIITRHHELFTEV